MPDVSIVVVVVYVHEVYGSTQDTHAHGCQWMSRIVVNSKFKRNREKERSEPQVTGEEVNIRRSAEWMMNDCVYLT